VVTLYSRLDALALERVVGTERGLAMIKADAATHMFC
jgi:hypothetical protein